VLSLSRARGAPRGTDSGSILGVRMSRWGFAHSAEPRLVRASRRRCSVPANNQLEGSGALSRAATIDEAQLEALVPCFYARVRDDALIGPVFDGAVADWDDHFEKLIAFWSSVMLTSGRYKGNPVAAHMQHRSAITPPMFDRWLSLWAEVTDEILPVSAAAEFQARASRIAESLKLALFFRLPPPGESPAIVARNVS